MLIANITKKGDDISIHINGDEVLYRDMASYAIYDTDKRETSLQYLQNNGGYVCITYKNGSTEWLASDTKTIMAMIYKVLYILEYKVLCSKIWNYSIMAVILLNSIILGLDTIKSINVRYGSLISMIDSICIVLFVVELLFRISAYRLRFFIGKDWGWNWFDFIVVTVSVFASNGCSIFRAFRIVRIFRILSIVPSLRIISQAVLRTIPSMISIMVLLFILYYIYGVLCVNLFGGRFPEFFGDLAKSFFTLFQIMTLEGRAEIVRRIMEVYPYAWVVFVSYIFIVSFVMLNLIVGVVVDSIAEIKANQCR